MNLANLHPLLVHLPIGIFFIGFLIELWNLKNPNKLSKDLMLFILANAALFALLSVLTGWFLGDSGSYDETALDRHKWLGIAFTVSAIVLFFVKRSNRALAQKAYLPLFSVCLVLLTLTGHYGGNMTHGEGFLFADHSAKVVEIENIEEAQVYQQIIHPILETKCVGCHNSNKLEGGLILKTQQQLLAGGDSGHLFDTLPEHGATLFMHRLRLPIEHEEHMPPEGKQQLTEEEILLMEWWIANKNCFELSLIHI